MITWKLLKRQSVWLRLLFLLFLIGLTFSYAMFQGGFVSWFLFYSMLPMGGYAVLLTFYSMKQFHITRKLDRKTVEAGELLKVTVTVKRNSIFPLFYVVVQDNLPPKLQMTANNAAANHHGARALFFPFLKRSMSYSYEIHSLSRGFYKFDEIVIKTGDPFGFMQKERAFLQEDSLLVYPAFQRIHWKPSERIKNGTKPIQQQGDQDLTAVVGIRDYNTGDRLSLLHWKASAKRNQLVTKEFEQQTNEKAVLFLDCISLQKGREENSLFEKMISLSASLAHSLLRLNYHLGIAAAGKGYMKIPLQSGKEQERRISHFLAKIDNHSEQSFVSVLQKEMYHYPSETAFLIITAHLSGELVQVLKHLALNKRHVTLFYTKLNKTFTEKEQQYISSIENLGIIIYQIIDNNFEAELQKGDVRYAAGRTKPL